LQIKNSVHMSSSTKIWIWVHNNRLLKAVVNLDVGTLTIYDDHDNVLLRRTGLKKPEMKKIEIIFSRCCATSLGENREPFTYL